MKKLTTKLLMSIIAVAFAFVALGTSTYAWFAMNTNVTANNIQLTAKSDNIFLQIKNASDESANAAKTQAAAVTASKEVYPVDYKSISAAGAVAWGTSTSDDPTQVNYTAKADLTDLASTTDHVWSDTFKFWISENASGSKGYNLKLTGVTVTGDDADTDLLPALRVLVVGGDGSMIWANTGASENSVSTAGITVINNKNLATAPTGFFNEVPNGETNAVEATVYVYFCGNDASVTTEQAQDLDQLTISLSFAVDSTNN